MSIGLGLSNNNGDGGCRACSLQAAYSPSRLAWSEGRQPLGAPLHSSDEPRVRRTLIACVRVTAP